MALTESVIIEGKGRISLDGDFIFPTGQTITSTDLSGLINYHKSELRKKYIQNLKDYRAKHEILDMKVDDNKLTASNKLVVNLPKYIVDTFNGFFIGIPVKIQHSDDQEVDDFIDSFENLNAFEDLMSETSKDSSLFGRSYVRLYQDEDALTRAVELSPLDTFMVYDDSVAHRPVAFVQYASDDSINVTGTMITASEVFDISGSASSVSLTASKEVNPFAGVPCVEFEDNSDHMGILDGVKTLYDAYDESISNKKNDVDYFADAYMKILGAKLDDEKIKSFRTQRVITFEGDGMTAPEVDFIKKPSDDAMQEHMLDRLRDEIFWNAQVANISDTDFGTSSGVSLKWKVQAMRNMATNKKNKFIKSLKDLFKLTFSIPTNVPAGKATMWQDIEFKFTENLPEDLLYEANTAKTMMGVTSHQKALEVLSVVDDPEKEMEEIADEQEEAIKRGIKAGDQYEPQNEGDGVDDQTEMAKGRGGADKAPAK